MIGISRALKVDKINIVSVERWKANFFVFNNRWKCFVRLSLITIKFLFDFLSQLKAFLLISPYTLEARLAEKVIVSEFNKIISTV